MKTVVNASFCPRPKYEATNNGKQTVEPYENANLLAYFRSKIRWKIFFQKISLKIFKGKSSWIENNKNSLFDKIFQNTTQLFLKADILIHFLWVLVEDYCTGPWLCHWTNLCYIFWNDETIFPLAFPKSWWNKDDSKDRKYWRYALIDRIFENT